MVLSLLILIKYNIKISIKFTGDLDVMRAFFKFYESLSVGICEKNVLLHIESLKGIFQENVNKYLI